MAGVRELRVVILGDSSGAERAFGGLDSGLAKVGLAVAAVGIAAGAAALKLGADFDDASDAIRLATGATGDRLKGLEADFKTVFTSVPTSMEGASTAVAELAQRTGLAGKPLQELSKQVIELSRLTGTDLSANIAATTRVFGDWGIATDRQGPALDSLFRASQATGIGVDRLAESVVQFGAPLRQLGFGFEESAALMGKWEKEGVNAELALGGLKIGLGKFSAAGKEPADALAAITEQIKNAGSAGEANRIAIETFGQRAGPDMAAAVREGRFELGELFSTVTSGKETILGAAADTNDFAESWTIFRNKVMVGLEPIATAAFEAVGKAFDALVAAAEQIQVVVAPILNAVVDGFRAMFGGFSTGATEAEASASTFAAVMQSVGEAARRVIEWIKDNWPAIRETIGNVVDWIAANVAPKVAAFARFLIERMGDAVAWVKDNWDQITETVERVINATRAVIEAVIAVILLEWRTWGDEITQVAQAAWDHIGRLIEAAVKIIQGVIELVMAIITGEWGKAWDAIKQILAGVWDVIVSYVTYAAEILRAAIEAVLSAIRLLWDTYWAALKSVVMAIWDVIVGAVTGYIGVVRDVIGSVLGAIRAAWDAAWSAIRSVIDVVWGAIGGVVTTAMGVVTSAIQVPLGLLKIVWEQTWNGIKTVIETVWAIIKAIFDKIVAGVGTVTGAVGKVVDLVSKVGGVGLGLVGKIPGFARGVTNFQGGFAIVGEEGPELVNLPSGSDVIPAEAIPTPGADNRGGGGELTLFAALLDRVTRAVRLLDQAVAALVTRVHRLIETVAEMMSDVEDATAGMAAFERQITETGGEVSAYTKLLEEVPTEVHTDLTVTADTGSIDAFISALSAIPTSITVAVSVSPGDVQAAVDSALSGLLSEIGAL